ncbi:MAG TPA: diol dehydratase small subunit [Roseiflexaceae bacterium]|jgi:propanediol dehydratase small subunit|nr:diol dehydratase small subunit [Roseiflexaceae bacterium]
MSSKQYPLMENAADTLESASGRKLTDITLEAVSAGELDISDLQIQADTLRAQADIAREAGFHQLAANLARAAELTAVPNADVLRMYEQLRPGRASYEELSALAELLEQRYHATETARMVREAATVYQARGLLKRT